MLWSGISTDPMAVAALNTGLYLLARVEVYDRRRGLMVSYDRIRFEVLIRGVLASFPLKGQALSLSLSLCHSQAGGFSQSQSPSVSYTRRVARLERRV